MSQFPNALLRGRWVLLYNNGDIHFTKPFQVQAVLTFEPDPQALPNLPDGETWLVAHGHELNVGGGFGPMHVRLYTGTHAGFTVEGQPVQLTSFCMTWENPAPAPGQHAYYAVWSGYHQVFSGGISPRNLTHALTIRGLWTDFEHNHGCFELSPA